MGNVRNRRHSRIMTLSGLLNCEAYLVVQLKIFKRCESIKRYGRVAALLKDDAEPDAKVEEDAPHGVTEEHRTDSGVIGDAPGSCLLIGYAVSNALFLDSLQTGILSSRRMSGRCKECRTLVERWACCERSVPLGRCRC